DQYMTSPAATVTAAAADREARVNLAMWSQAPLPRTPSVANRVIMTHCATASMLKVPSWTMAAVAAAATSTPAPAHHHAGSSAACGMFLGLPAGCAREATVNGPRSDSARTAVTPPATTNRRHS